MTKSSGNQRLSVFNYNPANYFINDEDEDMDYSERADRVVPFTRPQDLPPNSSAAEVIKAWAAQLKGF